MILLTICAITAFCWLLFEAIKLSFKVAWGLEKIVGAVLCVAAFPLLIVFVISVGGFLLILPIVLVAAACGILKSAI